MDESNTKPMSLVHLLKGLERSLVETESGMVPALFFNLNIHKNSTNQGDDDDGLVNCRSCAFYNLICHFVPPIHREK